MTKKLTSTALKKRLRECTQDELIDLIQRLYGAVPEAADMINLEYGDADYAASLLDKAKKQVRDRIYKYLRRHRCALLRQHGRYVLRCRQCAGEERR